MFFKGVTEKHFSYKFILVNFETGISQPNLLRRKRLIRANSITLRSRIRRPEKRLRPPDHNLIHRRTTK